jgi:uncharacterized Zn finger protein (UPF0148 family)
MSDMVLDEGTGWLRCPVCGELVTLEDEAAHLLADAFRARIEDETANRIADWLENSTEDWPSKWPDALTAIAMAIRSGDWRK